MMVSNAIGITVGIVMGKKIPERLIKWFSALIFITFGLFGLYESLPEHIWTLPVIAAGSVLLLLPMYLISSMNVKKAKGASIRE